MPAERDPGPAVRRRIRLPGDALLHPLPLAAIVLLALNDRVLKAGFPGPVTGKLSDIAGLAFFPLLPLGLWEMSITAAGRWSGPRLRPLVASVAGTGFVFAAVKLSQPLADAGAALLGIAALPLAPAGVTTSTSIVADPSDLLALLALLLPAWAGMRRIHEAPTLVASPASEPAIAAGAGNGRSAMRRDVPPRRIVAALAAGSLVAAATGTQPNPSAPPEATAVVQSPFTLTSNAPVAVRAFTFTVTNTSSQDVTGSYGAGGELDDTMTALPDPWLGVAVSTIDPAGPERTGTAELDCAAGQTCTARMAVEIRWLKPTAGKSVNGSARASVGVRGTNGPASPVPFSVSVAEDAAARFDGRPDVRYATASGTVHVTPEYPILTQHLRLDIAADVLTGPLSMPFVGRIGFVVPAPETFALGTGPVVWLYLATPALPDSVSASAMTDADFLAFCRPHVACSVPLTIELGVDRWWSTDAPPFRASAAPIDVPWKIEARLERFDGHPVPAGDFKITVLGPPLAPGQPMPSGIAAG